MSIKGDIGLALKKRKLAKQWRTLNSHNFTTVDGVFNLSQVSVGRGTYGTLHVDSFGNTQSRLTIGHYCSIAREVRFIIDGEHDLSEVSLYPFKRRYLGADNEAMSKGGIQVDDDVWIGERCLILSGVHIGQGAVIGAGSVVAKDIPPYAVFAGGRILKYRFTEQQIEQLLKFDFGKLTPDDIRTYQKQLYSGFDGFVQSELYQKYSDA